MRNLRIVGGDVALDLVNTVEPRIAGREPERDHLRTSAALLHWAERTELIDASESRQVAAVWDEDPDLAAVELDTALRLRSAVGTAIDAARARTSTAEEARALQVVVQQAASALTRTTLALDPDARQPAIRHTGTEPAHRICDRLALDALEMLQTTDLSRLKACPPEHGGCGWLFVDTSKNGTRRWCSMEDCGTQAKSRRLTERRRAQREISTATRA